MDCPDKIPCHQVHHPITELATGTGIGDPPLGNPVTPDDCMP